MLKLGRKVEYGLMALLHMGTLPEGDVAAAREIAEHYNIPPEILGKVLQSLKRARLLRSVQGAHGGYRLARPLANIVIGEVMEALDGPIQIATCVCYGDTECDQIRSCNIKSLLTRFRLQLQDFLYSMPLSTVREDEDNDQITGMTVRAAVRIPQQRQKAKST